MSSPLPESEDSPVISEKNWTLRYDDCTTPEYGSPDSYMTDTTCTAETTNLFAVLLQKQMFSLSGNMLL